MVNLELNAIRFYIYIFLYALVQNTIVEQIGSKLKRKINFTDLHTHRHIEKKNVLQERFTLSDSVFGSCKVATIGANTELFGRCSPMQWTSTLVGNANKSNAKIPPAQSLQAENRIFSDH